MTADEWVAPYGKIYSADSFYDFDGVWWLAYSGVVTRSPDRGQTWIWTTRFEFPGINHWTEFNGTLYAAGEYFARYNPGTREWEYFSEGLLFEHQPTSSPDAFSALAVNRGRLFASTLYHGVYLFDDRSETFNPHRFRRWCRLRSPLLSR